MQSRYKADEHSLDLSEFGLDPGNLKMKKFFF